MPARVNVGALPLAVSEDDSTHSTREQLLDEWQRGEYDGMPRLPSSLRNLSRRSIRFGLTAVVMLLVLAGVVLGRLSADPSFFPVASAVPPQYSSVAAATAHDAAILANNPPPSFLTSSEQRPSAFMNLFHNTLLPDLSLSSQPYPVSTTRLPGGELPSVSVYYCMHADWFQAILDDTFPALFASYQRVEEWDPAMPNLWSLQSFSPDGHPVPETINRAIGQRRIFITGQPSPSMEVYDMDAILDTKTSPFTHPVGANFVYFPNVYAAHYDFIKAGQSTREQPGQALSLIKPAHLSQLSNFQQRMFMAYMQGNCVAYRDELFDLISQYKRVDGIGSCRHNVPEQFDRKNGWWEAVHIYRSYKFVLCLESAQLDGYISEKILGPMLSGAIPVYYGSGDIGEHFNEKSFINVARFSSIEKVMERLIYLDQNDTAYAEVLDEPWLNGNRPSMWMPHGNTGSYLHQQLAALRDVLLHPNYTQRGGEGLPKWAKVKQGWKGNSDVDYLRAGKAA